MALFDFLFPLKVTELNKQREDFYARLSEQNKKLEEILSTQNAQLEVLKKDKYLVQAMIYSTAYRLKMYMDVVAMKINNREERIAVSEGLMADFPELTAGDIKDIFDKIYVAVEHG